MSDDDKLHKAPRERSPELSLNFQEWEQEIGELLNQVTLQKDAITGAILPRDLSHLKMSEAVEPLKMLRTASEFTKEPPPPVNTVARRLFAAINEKVGEVSPEIQRLLEEEASLARARDAAQKVYEQYLSEKSRFGKPVIYWGAALGLYLALNVLGILPVAAVCGAVALWAFGRSTICRTFRAAVHVRLADMLDGLGRGRQNH